MKLFYAPGACSLASHIVLREIGLQFELCKVDLKTRRLDDGADFARINRRGTCQRFSWATGSCSPKGRRFCSTLPIAGRTTIWHLRTVRASGISCRRCRISSPRKCTRRSRRCLRPKYRLIDDWRFVSYLDSVSSTSVTRLAPGLFSSATGSL